MALHKAKPTSPGRRFTVSVKTEGLHKGAPFAALLEKNPTPTDEDIDNMIEVFRKAKVDDAVAALETIYAEEVAHVAYGSKWFHFLCGRSDLDPKVAFHHLVKKYFHSPLKPPFNEEKRAEAGLPPDFYWPLAVAD